MRIGCGSINHGSSKGLARSRSLKRVEVGGVRLWVSLVWVWLAVSVGLKVT